MKLATCLAFAGFVAVTQGAALRKHDRATLQAVERIGNTAFGETLLLSVKEKMAQQSPVEEILELLDTIEDAILGEQKDELRRIEPQRKRCQTSLKKLEGELASLKAHLSADDCSEHGSAALRASIADDEKRAQELKEKKATREVELRATKAHVEASAEKLSGHSASHGKALDAVSRISDILSEMQGQAAGAGAGDMADVTALLDLTTQATETATDLARKTQAALEGNDAEAVATLLSKLKEHLHGSLKEYKSQHEDEVKDWKDVQATQEAAIGAVEQEISHLHDRVEAAKARLAAAAAGKQQCLKEVSRAREDQDGRQESVDAKRSECKTIEEAYERERSHRKDELDILEQVRAIVIDKLDAMGDFLRQRIRTVMGTGATGAAEPAEAQETDAKKADAPVAATGAASEALEAMAANEEEASDVPPGAMERMPADRYTATGTVEDVLHAQGSAGMGVAREGPNAAVDAIAQQAVNAVSMPLDMDVVVSSTGGSTGATGSVGSCSYNYAGLTGPDFWQSLCGGKWAACNSRDGMQSPINVPENDAKVVDGSALTDIALYHSVSGLSLDNDGNALVIQGNFGSFKLGSKTLQARRIVFRASSEHAFDGRYAHVEMQIHHVADGANVVVSVFFDRAGEGEQDSGLLWNLGFSASDDLPRPGQSMALSNVRLGDFARSAMTGAYYHYTGSLTAPPCTNDAEWFLVKSPLKVPAKFIASFENTIDDLSYPASGNNRPTQPLRSRIVELVEPSTFA